MRSEFDLAGVSIDAAWIVVGSSIGAFLGALAESRGWMGGLSFLARPLSRFGRLPDVCGAAFVTAFASNNAAGSMLAEAHAAGRITRFQMIVGAIVNSFPAKTQHLARAGWRILPLLGLTALAYMLLQILIVEIYTIIVLTVSRFVSKPAEATAMAVAQAKQKPSFKESVTRSLRAAGKLALRVLCISVPIFILVCWLADKGAFKKIEKAVPAPVARAIPHSALAIMTAKMGGLVGAAGVAAKMLKEGTATVMHVLIALTAANMLTLPFSALRRNLPSALGIFPKRDGVWIVAVSQGARFVLNIALLALLIAFSTTPAP